MKKVLFILAAMCCMTYAWSATTYEKVDKVPNQEAYMTNIAFDATTNTLTFTDNYDFGVLYDRQYVITFYQCIKSGVHETGLYKVTNSGESVYVYGYPIMNGNKIAVLNETTIPTKNWRVEKVFEKTNSRGGKCVVNVNEQAEQIAGKGIGSIRVVISLLVNINGTYVSAETQSVLSYGKEHNNYIDTYVGKFSYNNLAWLSPQDFSHPERVFYGDSVKLMSMIMGVGQSTYRLQESEDSTLWRTIQTGIIAGANVREGEVTRLTWEFKEDGKVPQCWYRVVAEDNNSHVCDTSEVRRIDYFYPWIEGTDTVWHQPGDKFNYPLPADCEQYYAKSVLPVQQKKEKSSILFTQPACSVNLSKTTPLYFVRFYNADNSIISVSTTPCGGDAVPPANPSYGKYVFKGWSRDFTNVHNNINVYARYELEGDYYFESALTAHTNKRYPADGFEGSDKRAMIGDSVTFEADICAKFEMHLYYEYADLKDNEGNWMWSDPISVGWFTAEEASQSWTEAKKFSVTRSIGYEYWQEKAFIPGYAFRFDVLCQGEHLYSEPYEMDVYYPLSINSQIVEGKNIQGDPLYGELMFENSYGDLGLSSFNDFLPARYKDTVRIYRMNGGAGACMEFARVNKPQPQYALEHGEDKDDNAFVIAPGEAETLNVTAKQYAVVFENAEPVSNYDFSEQGLHKWNNKYYAEVVSCGGAVQNMPADPKRASEIFLGWINNTTGDYADDDYMHVPALSGSDDYLIFEAKWEELDLPLYAVRFFDKEGSQIGSVQNIAEGNDAVPPVAPEVSGYVFVGWDKPYTCITADVDINALYGKEDTYWTVTYYDENGTAKLHEEQVFDNTAAVGFTPTKAGMQFYYWADKTTDSPADLQHVTKDMEVRAVFADALHTVAFRVEGVTVKTIQVAHGADFQSVKPTPDPTRPATEAKIFAFDHWTPELTVINEDITFDAVFTESARTYTVRFQNWNHDLIETQQVEYGKAATAPADPTREGYIFTGWDHEFDNILADMTVTAQYKKNKGTDEPQTPTYKVTIITPEHGAIQVKESYDLDAVPENTVLHLTAVPDSGYEFKQWNDGKTDNPLEVTITKDIAFSADFEKIPDSLDEINVETSLAPVKTLINGNLFIITPDGRMFNATGAEVR